MRATLRVLVEVVERVVLLLTPIRLAVHILSLAVVTVVVVAHVPRLTFLVPIVRLATASVALRRAVTIETNTSVAVAIDAV